MDVEMSSMDATFGRIAMAIPWGVPVWQVTTVTSILTFLYMARVTQLTLVIRNLVRPWTVERVKQDLWVVLAAQVRHLFHGAILWRISAL
jgi:hypothetical protein